MARLKAAARRKLPGKDFAGPGRSFPVEDKNHAKAALSLVGRSSLSPAEKAKVRSRAEAKLHGKSGDSDGDGKRAGARDGMGHGRGGMAVHSSAKSTNMHSDRMMHEESY